MNRWTIHSCKRDFSIAIIAIAGMGSILCGVTYAQTSAVAQPAVVHHMRKRRKTRTGRVKNGLGEEYLD